jgi:flagella basal body P-ring formation protein FlgA
LPPELHAAEVRVPSSIERGPGGDVEVTWRRAARPGWLTLRVRVGDRAGWVRARLAAVLPAVVAARDLAAGHSIVEEDVRVEMRPAPARASKSGAVMSGVEGVVGRVLRQPVAAGAPVPPGSLERSAPLPRGHQVTAQVRRGRLSISAAGVLERPASIGGPTLVRLRSSGHVVRGRLIDSHTVLIEVSP